MPHYSIKRILYAFILIFITQSSYSQSKVGAEIFNSLKPTIAPSPTSASLGSFADYPVTQFHGLPDITVPLYDINLPEIKIPISLSYNPNLVKVNTLASWVGLGWALNAGGVITRTVKDIPDDMNFTKIGMLHDCTSYPATDPNIYVSDSLETMTYENDCITASKLWRIISVKGYSTVCDAEPDIFYFNFFNRTGKFFINKDLTVRQIPYTDLKISVELDGVYPDHPMLSNGIKKISVTDEKGVKYIFNTVERMLNQYDVNPYHIHGILLMDGTGSKFGRELRSSWYLSKIILPNLEEVDFLYTDEIFTYNNPTQISTRNCPDMDCENSVSASLGQGNYPQLGSAESASMVYGKRLSSIQFSTGRIDFEGSQERLDLKGSYALKGISVYNISNQLIKKYELDYFYHPCDISEPDRMSHDLLIEENDHTVRLFLRGINEASTISSLKEVRYSFEYDERKNMPMRGSMSQDFWGFFNDSKAKTLIPRLYIYPELSGGNRYRAFPYYDYAGAHYELSGANRNCNSSVITVGTLKSITFPTGGKSEFEFEPHDFLFELRNTVGGGLRLKRNTVSDGMESNNTLVKEYSYNSVEPGHLTESSGRLFSLPVFAYMENTHGYETAEQGGNFVHPQNITGIYDQNFYKYFLTRVSFPNEVLNGYDGLTVAYRYLTEHVSGNGKTVYHFSVPAKYGDKNDLSDEYDDGNCNIAQDGYCDNLYEPAITYYCEAPNFQPHCGTESYQFGNNQADLDGINIYTSASLPFAQNTNYDWNRGLLLSKKDYAENGNLVRELSNYYNTYTKNNAGPFYVKGLAYKATDNWKLDLIGTNLTGGGSDIILFTPYKIITGITKVLTQTTESIYDAENPSIRISKTLNYTYKSGNLLTASVEETNSNGTIAKTQFNYATDYSSLLPYQNMIAKNMLDYQVEINKTGTNNQQLSKSSVVYKEWATGVFKPHKLKQSFFLGPETEKLNFISYDDRGYPTSFIDNTGIINSYVLDVKKQIIASVVGAPASQIFFSSFEEEVWDENLSAYDNSKTHTGSFSGRIDKPSSGILSATSNWMLTSLNAPTKFKFSGWVYSSGSGAAIVLMMKRANEVSAYSYIDQINTSAAGSWIYLEKEYTVPQDVVQFSIRLDNNGGGSVWYDDIRVHPSDAFMTTYTYKQLVGQTSKTDEKQMTEYYEYDDFNRLSLVRDNDKNIIKQFNYQLTNASQSGSTAPNWVATGNTRCKPCTQNANYTSNMSQVEKKDMNPLSLFYNETTWVDSEISPTCGIPEWQLDYISCQSLFGVRTGYQIQAEKDMNPCSPTWNQTRESLIQNTAACPPGTVRLIIENQNDYGFSAFFDGPAFQDYPVTGGPNTYLDRIMYPGQYDVRVYVFNPVINQQYEVELNGQSQTLSTAVTANVIWVDYPAVTFVSGQTSEVKIKKLVP